MHSPAQADDILTCPERFKIVEFNDWLLPSGRRVSFKLGIPREKYDGFELIRLLNERERRLAGGAP